MLRLALGAVLMSALLLISPVLHAAEARRVVVVVWDGMRPDFIRPELTPTLCQLASNGVFFANHHPVYCSSTEANGTAIATGAYPSHSGVIANNDFQPAIDPTQLVVMAQPDVIAKGDAVTKGKFIARPTVAEVLQAAGVRTAIAGSKHVALLHDRRKRADDAASVCVHEGEAQPDAALPRIRQELGAFPKKIENTTNARRDEWTRRTLTEVLWSNGVPAFSLLWLGEPDVTQHATSPGSSRALEAIRNSDRQLAAVLAELEQRGLRAQADILVVSDHGFSTIEHKIDTAAILKTNGFVAHRGKKPKAQTGDIIVASQGGSDLFFVVGNDRETLRKFVVFLQQQEWAGVIFSRESLPGTFPIAAAHLDRLNPPDVVLGLRWSAATNRHGAPGLYYCDGGAELGGAHASLSRFDMHSTLVASGPHFKKGVVNELPSANTDIAPTILWLLGIKPSAQMDGRVLGEAMTVEAPPVSQPQTTRLEAATTNGVVVWKQYLQTSKVNDTVYLEEGNGSQTIRP